MFLCLNMFLIIMFFKVSTADTDVSCVVMESCILPCSVKDEDEIVIHWFQMTPVKTRVHSFYQNQNQLGHQDQRFRGRTLMFQDQISEGNVSLLLKMVKVQDQGRYQCYVSAISRNQEFFINLKVDAPVKKVNMDHVENRITCSSEGIYPEPELTWSTRPPSSTNLQNTTTIQQTEQQLYNISSSLVLSDSDADLIYSCTISTGTNQRRSSLQRLSSFSSSTETTLVCSASNSSLTNLVWRFNHSQIILNKAGPDVTYMVSEDWRQHVKDVSESGSITLQDLSPHQEGVYTCELSNAEETMITETFVRRRSQGNTLYVGFIVGVLVLVTAAVVGLVMFIKKKGQEENRRSTR